MSLLLEKMPNGKIGLSSGMTDVKNRFEALKKLCSECPVLAYADYSKPFVLHTDASTVGLGAVLYQKQEDGKDRVIAYASRTLIEQSGTMMLTNWSFWLSNEQ